MRTDSLHSKLKSPYCFWSVSYLSNLYLRHNKFGKTCFAHVWYLPPSRKYQPFFLSLWDEGHIPIWENLVYLIGVRIAEHFVFRKWKRGFNEDALETLLPQLFSLLFRLNFLGIYLCIFHYKNERLWLKSSNTCSYQSSLTHRPHLIVLQSDYNWYAANTSIEKT